MTHKRGQTDRVLFVNSDFCRRGVRIRRFWEVATEPGAETGSRRAEIIILGACLILTTMLVGKAHPVVHRGKLIQRRGFLNIVAGYILPAVVSRSQANTAPQSAVGYSNQLCESRQRTHRSI
jgi:hypothetical protein